MPALGEANRLLIIGMHHRLRQPHTGKSAALLGDRQRSIGHQTAEAGDILGGLAPPRDPVHDGPAAGHRVLEGADSEAIAVDHLGPDAEINEVVDQRAGPGHPQPLVNEENAVIMQLAVQTPRHGVLPLALGKIGDTGTDGVARRAAIREHQECSRP